MNYAITAPTLFDGHTFHTDHCVVIEGERITEVLPTEKLPNGMERQVLTEGILAPGFIDIQVNGGGGVMLNNTATREGVDQMARGHRPYGTTSMMPTLISDTREVQQAGIDAVRTAKA
ncbi:MAG: N-acetylglucosamine-6-phosphate deacetylase, partial [Halioglobus sp.]